MKNVKSLLENLVRFNTVSKESTTDIINYIANYMEDLGFEVDVTEDPKHQNLIAKNNSAINCENEGKFYYGLCGHVDTVPPALEKWETDPFKLTKKEEKLYGLGSSDMKGPITCMIKSLEAITKLSKEIPAALVLTHSEEIGLLGAKELVESESLRKKLEYTNLIIGEPTEFEIGYTHKGYVKYRIDITGKEEHSSRPHKGNNAIYCASRLSLEIEKLNNVLMAKPSKDFEYGSTVNLGLIEGGAEDRINFVCGKVSLYGDLRLIPEENKKTFDNALHKIIDSLSKDGFEIKIETLMDDAPFYMDPGTELISDLSSTLGKIPIPLNYATDAAIFNGTAKIPCAIIGPGNIRVCHKPDEYISINDLEKGVELYKKIFLTKKHVEK